MNCKRCEVTLTKAHEKEICTRCGQDILRGKPRVLDEKPSSFADQLRDALGGFTVKK